MTYLARLTKDPGTANLTPDEISFVNRHFDVNPQMVTLNGVGISWDDVDEIEVAQAARTRTASGWFVKNILFGGKERYHVAIYSGRNETVLPNISRAVVEHIVQTIAYYAPKRIAYKGVEGISPLSDESSNAGASSDTAQPQSDVV